MSTTLRPFQSLSVNGKNGDSATQIPTDLHTPPVGFEAVPSPEIPIGFVPTPTIEFRARQKQRRNSVNTNRPTAAPVPPIPGPLPTLRGPRILMYKQDPSVAEIGIRKAFLPGLVVNGPKDARIQLAGVAPVSVNALGDLIGPPAGSEGFDAVHTFSVVRQTLTMYQRVLGGAALPWQWNSASNSAPLTVFPRAGDTANAFYSRNERALKFFFFTPPGSPPATSKVFTCRSLDIVAHETGHAILDALKPQWILSSSTPQTGGLHESFGDLTAIFLTLSQLDQCEAFIAQTKANLHAKSFLSDMAEEFGLALGRPNGLRNADNDFKLSEVGNEVHAISQVFTGGIYDVLADIFAFEARANLEDEAVTLHRVSQYMCSLVLRAIGQSPATNATYADVVNRMLTITASDGKPVQYRNSLRNRFTFREVVVAPTPLAADQPDSLSLTAAITDDPEATQDRHGCCGTMQHAEYSEDVDARLEEELVALRGVFKDRDFITKLFDQGTPRPVEVRATPPSAGARGKRKASPRKR